MRPDTTTSYLPADRGPLAWVVMLGYEYFVLCTGYLLFGAICLSWSLIATLLYPLLPRRIGAPLGQFVIMAVFRLFLLGLRASRIVKCDLAALDALRDERALVIAPNHPSLLDVVLVASRLPHVVCIMKAEIWDNPFLGGGARLAGYIRNDSPGNMVSRAADAIRAGSQLLVFPEGTRTVREPVNPFKGGFVLMAKKAGAPVQTVFIESNSRFLCKGWPLFKKPAFPLTYCATLGRRFEVHGDTKEFVEQLESYYCRSLNPGNAQPGDDHS